MGKIATGATIIVAGLVGAGIMMLYAPASGKKMRKRLLNRGMDLRDDALDRAEDLQKNASKLIKLQNRKLSKEAKHRMKMARGVAEDFRDSAQDRMVYAQSKVGAEAKRRMSDIRDRSDDLMDRGRSAYKTKKKKGLGGFIGAGRRALSRY